ncbi:Multidrug resistance protein CDR2 [Vanrija pseudolonga]|uniref:Multidrug resistance protein CDR2 n=1 Tax=Vanrija pseudolonga TaxID=143232 RepID=A0AAF0YH76_9TREE|nr:Multidrug resistance protein CDR2 [Vanrija pseudolonga]
MVSRPAATTCYAAAEFLCMAPDLAPYGPGYENGPKGWSVTDSSPGSIYVSGEKYIREVFGFKMDWRNFGLITGFWLHSAFLGMLALTYLADGGIQFMRCKTDGVEASASRDDEDGGIFPE